MLAGHSDPHQTGRPSVLFIETDAQHMRTKFAAGQLVYVMDAKKICVHDGATKGGVMCFAGNITPHFDVNGSGPIVVTEGPLGTFTVDLDLCGFAVPSNSLQGKSVLFCDNGQLGKAPFYAQVTNTPPVAHNDTVVVTQGATMQGTVATNDTDENPSTLTYSLLTQPVHGAVVMQPTGAFVYTPANGYYGPDVFSYQVMDAQGLTDSANVSLTVQHTNIAPLAGNDTFATQYNTAFSGTVALNDSDPEGQQLSNFVVINQPVHGSLTFNVNGAFTYVPAAGWSGSDSFTYLMQDSDGGISNTATVTIMTAAPVNNAPVVQNDTFTTAFNTAYAGSVTNNDSDPDGNALVNFYVLTQPAHGNVTMSSNGTFNYVPTNGYSGSDTFTYRCFDTFGLSSNTATVTINVGAALNNPPVVQNDAFVTDFQTVYSGTVAANDSDPDGDPLLFSVVTLPGHGSVVFNANGTFVYTPATGYSGADSFVYKAVDGHGGQNQATVNITVNPAANQLLAVDDGPIRALGHLANGYFNVAPVTTFFPLGNDSDTGGHTFQITAASCPAVNGAVTFTNNSIAFTPASNAQATFDVNYTITNSVGQTASAKITVLLGSVVYNSFGNIIVAYQFPDGSVTDANGNLI